MGIYLLSRGLNKQRFMGTRAWFFFIVNLAKLPVYIPEGMITPGTLISNARFLPCIVLGVCAGFLVLDRIPQKIFNYTVLFLAGLAAVKMVVSG